MIDEASFYRPSHEALELLWQEAGERVAARLLAAGLKTPALAIRLTRFLARQLTFYDPQIALRLARSWYMTAHTELCWILPARELARLLVCKAEGRAIVLPFLGDRQIYFGEWTKTDPDVLYLVLFLKKLDAITYFVRSDEKAHGKGRWDLRLEPSPLWNHDQNVHVYAKHGLHPFALRGSNQVLAKVQKLAWGRTARWKTGRQKRRQKPVCQVNELPSFHLSFTEVRDTRLLALDVDLVALRRQSHLSVRRHTHRNFRLARRWVQRHGLQVAHICDEPSFGSSIFSAAVESLGGGLVLWPHSTNPCAVGAYRGARLKAVHATMKRSAVAWAKDYPSIEVRVQPDLRLPKIRQGAAYVPGAPLHLILIGSGTHMHRYPIVHLARHRTALKTAIESIDQLGLAYRCFHKPKPGYETPELFRTFAPAGLSYGTIETSLAELDYPNMVFISISLGSSALVEGCAWGFPVVTVKDYDWNDYAPVPWQTPSALLGAHLQQLTSPSNWARRLRAQQDWLKQELRAL